MRILLLCNKPPFPPCDGGTIATFNLALGFDKLGHMVDILSISTSKHLSPNNSRNKLPGKIKMDTVFVNTDINVFKALNNLLFSTKPYIAARFVSKQFSGRLVESLSAKSYDIVQIEGLYMCQYIPLLKKHTPAKIAFRSHNLEHEIWERLAFEEKFFLKRIYLKILARRIKKMEMDFLGKYHVLLPISPRDAIQYGEFGVTVPMKVVPVGVFGENFSKYQNQPEFPSVFFIGALDWIPNQEGLLWFVDKVWGELANAHPKLNFYVAGRNAPKDFETKIKLKNVIFLGEIEDAYQFMSKMAIMVVPLFSGSGMRVKIIEGMALGKAIVATSVGAEGIAAKNGKHLLIADTKKDFMAQIEKLIDNFPYFETIMKNSGDFVFKNHDNLKISETLVEFYNSLLE